MIPLYRVSKMEQAVNMMAKHFRQIIVDTCHTCQPAIRFKPDEIVSARVYFAKTKSQIALWQNNGGVLIRWNRRAVTGPYEAILYAECPRSIAHLDNGAQDARWLAAVYNPPTWRIHFESLTRRMEGRTALKRRTVMDGLERVKQLVESTEQLTPTSFARLLLVHQGKIALPSSAPVLSSVGARVAGIASGAP